MLVCFFCCGPDRRACFCVAVAVAVGRNVGNLFFFFLNQQAIEKGMVRRKKEGTEEGRVMGCLLGAAVVGVVVD